MPTEREIQNELYENCLADLAARGVEIDSLLLAILKTQKHSGRMADTKMRLAQKAPSLVSTLNKYTNTSDFSTSLLECTIDICKRDPARTADLFDTLVSDCSTPRLITRVHAIAREECRKELVFLTEKNSGLHFNATNANPDQIDAFSLPEIRRGMKKKAPNVCNMIAMLLDARKSERRIAGPRTGLDDDSDDDETVAQALDKNPDLESDTEYIYASDSDASDYEEREVEDIAPMNKRQQRAVTRRDKLLKIKLTVIVSILAQSSNAKANRLQSLVGIFLLSTGTSERTMQIMARMGLSIAIQTANMAITSLSKHAMKEIVATAATLTAAPAYDNINIAFARTKSDTGESDFVNLTTATLVPMQGTQSSDLSVSLGLWDSSPMNENANTPIKPVASFDSLGFEDTSATDRLTLLDRSYEASVWHVKRLILEHARSSGYNNIKALLGRLGTTPGERNQIPIEKTRQVPLRTMEEDEATLHGNANVCKDILKQCSLTENVQLKEQVLPLHADLATVERIEGLQEQRKWNKTDLVDKLQYLICVPGLFHAIMAAAAAIHRIYWVKQPDIPNKPTVWGYSSLFTRPQEMARLGTNPGFRRTHNAILLLVEAFAVHLCEKSVEGHRIKDWFDTKPTWDDLDGIARAIVDKHAAGHGDEKGGVTRDKLHDNHRLMLRDLLIYVEFTHAIKHGDIGRVEDAIPFWVLIWKATGKHKYATYYHSFILKLRHWPASLTKVIRLNWLCNPTGKADGFRGVDWLVELNNLYIKVIFCGEGPNRSVELIKKYSILIELLRRCHAIFDDNFYNLSRTKRRSAPKMDKILAALRSLMDRFDVSKDIPGRSTTANYMDAIVVGMERYQAQLLDSTDAEVDPAERTAQTEDERIAEMVEDLTAV